MFSTPGVSFDSLRSSHRGIIGIISMGDMGSGIARLLVAHRYAVITNCTGRSSDTINRANQAGAHLVTSDQDLLHADLILSIVPPRDAYATAERIVFAVSSSSSDLKEHKTLYFADLNAVSPATVRSISSILPTSPSSSTSSPNFTIKFIDGAILGGPPSLASSIPVGRPIPPHRRPPSSDSPPPEWNKPSIPTSGPHDFSSIFSEEPNHLPVVLNAKHISPDIGAASGLKMTFASLSKGYAAIAVQAATTARNLGVLDHLKSSLREIMGEAAENKFEKAVTGMAPKAGRWVREMEEIAATHQVDGGLEPTIFLGAAEVFRTVAEDTVLGEEKIGKRNRGTTAEDVGAAITEGLLEKKRKGSGEEKKEEWTSEPETAPGHLSSS
ncbi:hypothetical protein QBC35DRAFT_502014 [Podospora australis]|uniref:Phosphogluconate dehydrogenase NAD-binding putative C-terminal domain-containing protein n=1 Tax=Podospora australis TaxID=1536484 RepID=A0AAN7AGW6_9PEZI|nr:hypothetical protein QBC35DRAFT_502014 [Podospora australis]